MFTIKNFFALVFFFLTTTVVFANETPQISQQALLTELQNANPSIIVLDVRSKDEYAQEHIAGAINFSHDTVAQNLDLLAQYKDKTVVVYCRSGRRASIAEEILINNGFNDIRHLTGDMNGWLEANQPVVSNNL